MSTEPPRRRTVRPARATTRGELLRAAVADLMVIGGLGGVVWVLATVDVRLAVAAVSVAAIRAGRG